MFWKNFKYPTYCSTKITAKTPAERFYVWENFEPSVQTFFI